MKFSELVDQAAALLERKGRLSYRAIRREFEIDDETLDDLQKELTGVLEVAVDKDGEMLVWTGGVTSTVDDAPVSAEARSATRTASSQLSDVERRQISDHVSTGV